MRRFVIGRDEDCDVVLPIASVSRRHAFVSLARNGKIHFEDAGSTNGSYMLEGDNLVRIKDIDLPPETLLQLGKHRISIAEILRCIVARHLGGAPGRQEAAPGPAVLRSLSGPGTG